MEYEYRSIVISSGGYDSRITSTKDLQDWFDNGWEYVDSISQHVATGSSGNRYGSVLVIIRKSKGVGFE